MAEQLGLRAGGYHSSGRAAWRARRGSREKSAQAALWVGLVSGFRGALPPAGRGGHPMLDRGAALDARSVHCCIGLAFRHWRRVAEHSVGGHGSWRLADRCPYGGSSRGDHVHLLDSRWRPARPSASLAMVGFPRLGFASSLVAGRRGVAASVEGDPYGGRRNVHVLCGAAVDRLRHLFCLRP